eukprot:1041475-Amphidinium_carterae.1
MDKIRLMPLVQMGSGPHVLLLAGQACLKEISSFGLGCTCFRLSSHVEDLTKTREKVRVKMVVCHPRGPNTGRPNIGA